MEWPLHRLSVTDVTKPIAARRTAMVYRTRSFPTDTVGFKGLALTDPFILSVFPGILFLWVFPGSIKPWPP